MRHAEISRDTLETKIRVKIDLDGSGKSQLNTGIGFFDHMLDQIARHGSFDLEVEAVGDLHIDGHHTVEDTAICIGQALRQALGDKAGIRRFGHAVVPLDEALADCVVDVAGRPYVVCQGEPDGQVYALIGGSGVAYAGSMTYHVVEALALNAGLCVHLTLRSGRDPHHIVEAQFKALARALRQAVETDPRQQGIPSTKGAL